MGTCITLYSLIGLREPYLTAGFLKSSFPCHLHTLYTERRPTRLRSP